MCVAENSLCKLSDRYFAEFASPNHVFNKQENRPYFYAVRGNNGIVWLIPLSSKVEKYRAKIKTEEEKYGECVFCYIARVKKRESAFLIGNVIPVTDEYIKGPFTVNNVPFVIENKNDIKQIKKRLNRYLAMVKQGKMKPAVNILEIEKKLLEK